MRLEPVLDRGAAAWAHDDGTIVALGVWTEKRPGRGEDAEPLVLHNYAAGRGMLAVCDGVGGAGVQTAGHTAVGIERTGAWVSSRGVRLAAEAYFLEVIQFDCLLPPSGSHANESGMPDSGGQADGVRPLSEPSLHNSVHHTLGSLRNPARSRIAGTMQRELPTTLAAILYHVQDTHVEFRVRWAGDSRCYLLTQQAGLQQLSSDDSEAADALGALEQDPPMTNQIAADGRYEIHNEGDQSELPCVLLCATDGFFNYVVTPAHFEYILLRTLADADSPCDWSYALAQQVQGYTQDDASIALAAFGYASFSHLRETFRERAARLESDHWQPFQGLDQADDQAIRIARLESWQRYQDNYERRMHRPKEASQ
jgi:serine/threonine protein phosphatase PrpC